MNQTFHTYRNIAINESKDPKYRFELICRDSGESIGFADGYKDSFDKIDNHLGDW